MKQFYAFLLIIFACTTQVTQAKRQRVIFINEAPEPVLVFIGHERIEPLQRMIVERGDKKYFFPAEIAYSAPLLITLDGMFAQSNYELRLTGNPQMSLTYACRSYGSLLLMRNDVVMASIGAGGLERGIVLTYTADYELKLSLFQLQERPHRRKHSCHRPTSNCRPCGKQKGTCS
jgi:hypothetical protein